MRRDRELLRRILLAVEALPRGGPHVLKMPSENHQDVLDHLDLLEQQGLIRALVHRAGGEVDHVAVHGLTPAGHDFLEAEPQTVHLRDVSARGVAAGEGSATSEGQVGPTGIAEAPTAPLGLNGTTGPQGPVIRSPQIGVHESSSPMLRRESGEPLLRADGSPHLREEADSASSTSIAATAVLEPLTVEATATAQDRRTIIIRTVLTNQVVVRLNALSLVKAIELKIETLRADGSNSEIAGFDDLKSRVEEFLAANARREEGPIADTTLSIADGLRRFWTEKHVSICEKALDMMLFSSGLAFCGVAGVLTVPTALTVGAIVGGKNVVEALKAAAKLLPDRGSPSEKPKE